MAAGLLGITRTDGMCSLSRSLLFAFSSSASTASSPSSSASSGRGRFSRLASSLRYTREIDREREIEERERGRKAKGSRRNPSNSCRICIKSDTVLRLEYEEGSRYSE